MSRISMISFSLMAALAFSPNAASAGSVTIHTPTPTPPVFTGKHIPVATIKAGVSSGSTGNATVSNIPVTKQTDKSSPNLFKNTATGKHYDSVTLHGGGKATPRTYELTDVNISHSSLSGGGGSPTESEPPPPPPK
jgi:Type VI secretion system effector, Hcp